MILGIESTAHTFSTGIYDEKRKKILSNAGDMFHPEHGWGIDPNKAREHHLRVKEKMLEKALSESGLTMTDINAIGYSAGPGLPPCLQVGHRFAVKLSEKHNIKLIPVNHCIAHIEIGRFLTSAKDPIILYVSGGNTQVLGYTDRYRCFGETLDKAVGAAIDTFIRKTDGRSPGGPIMEQLAKNGKYTELPYVVKGMDISVSGLLTASLEKAKTHKLEDVCFSFQETIYAMLTEITERAMAHTGKKELLLTGGVAASSRLQEMLKTMCKERGAKFYVCPKTYAGDNGAMIAYTASLAKIDKKILKQGYNPKWRTDEVVVI